MTEPIIIAGKACYIMENKAGGPIILWGMYPHQGNEIEHTWHCLMEAAGEKPFLLAAYQAENWNRDFSPWEAPAAYGGEAFGGGGAETLGWLTGQYIPWLRERFGRERLLFTAGYSLAGLFALWALYESDLFSGAVCCSGSLWFPGWKEYADVHPLKSRANVYLSLGGKEEKTKHTLMAAVGERTRQQEQLLKKDRNTDKVILEWNPGGHFADSGKRLAKGIRWILEAGF